MGTPASSNGCIGFTNETTAQFAHKLIEGWVYKANKWEFPKDSPDNGDYEIYDVDLAGSNIEFNAHSGKEANLEWQLERFCEFCKTLPDCLSFEANVMVQGAGICWQKEFDNPM
jgi:hypothetical protein